MLPTPKANELTNPIREALALVEGMLGRKAVFDPNSSKCVFKLAIGDYGEII